MGLMGMIRGHILSRVMLVIVGIVTVWWVALPDEFLKAFAISMLAGSLATLAEGLFVRASTEA